MTVGAPIDPPLPPDEKRANPSRWHWLDITLLILVLLIALGVRIASMGRPLSMDELWHLGISTANGSPLGQFEPDHVYLTAQDQTSLAGASSFWHIWTRMDGVLHPPLYMIVLRLWRDVFGESDAAAVSCSIAWSLVAIGFVFASARLVSDRYTAALVTVAMAVARTQVFLALAVRGYEMLIALGAIALWQMIRIETLGPTRRRMTTLALITLPLLLTHYFAIGAAAAIGLYGLVRGRGHRISFTGSILAAAAVYAVIWLPFARRQLNDLSTGDALVKLNTLDPAALAMSLLATPMRLIVDMPGTQSIAAAISVVAIVAIAIAWTLAPQKSRRLVPMVLWLVCTIGFIGLLDVARVTQHSHFIRYLSLATPAVFVIVAAAGNVGGRVTAILSGALLLALAVAFRLPHQPIKADGPEYSNTARWLAQHAGPGDALLVVDGVGQFRFGDMLLLHCSHEPGLFPRPIVKVSQPLSAERIALLPRRAWIVSAYADNILSHTFPSVRVLERHPLPEDGPGEIDLVDLRPDQR